MSKFDIVNKTMTDQKAEKTGIEFTWHGYKFFVKRAGGANTDFGKKYLDMFKDIANIEAIKDEIINERMATLVYESLLTGWEGIKDNETGGDAEFNKENAIEILTALPDLSESIIAFAKVRNNYLQSALEAKAGN